MRLIDADVAIDTVDSETVSTNPEHFKSSEKFIKFMDDDDIASFGRWQWANGFNTALVASKVQLERLPSAQPEQRWIPVERELPEENERVLICGVKGGIYIARRGETMFGKSAFWVQGNKIVDAIAWMPLPEPYQKGATT